MIFQDNEIWKQTWVVVSDKTGFKKDKDSPYSMIKGSIHEKDTV